MPPYRGRFAPTPSGPLHAGSLVAALASWLDARAHGGQWLVRIEDIDVPRCARDADKLILRQLAACGLVPDAVPQWQSRRTAAYASALATLLNTGAAYPCACSRKSIEAAWAARGGTRDRHGERIYPGTCRPAQWTAQPVPALSTRVGMRVRTDTRAGEDIRIHWHDRRLGDQAQSLATEVGDFIVRRSDGLWAYQLAVVVDDADQGITDVVRGEDLADNTPRQRHLQALLALPTPRYLHTPLVLDAHGEKLSKSTDAPPLDLAHPVSALQAAAHTLGLAQLEAATAPEWLAQAIAAWAARWR